MKNSDFDFISEKFKNSGVNAPENIDESYVKRQIAYSKPVAVKKGRGKIVGIISASAAAAAIVTAVSVVVSGVLGGIKPVLKPLAGTASLVSFSSRAEVSNAIKKVINTRENVDEALGSVRLLNNAEKDSIDYMPGSATHNTTYVQHTGVDEADTVKTDGKYIFYLSAENKIDVFLADKENTDRITSINFNDQIGSDDSYSYVRDFYIYSGSLVAIVETAKKVQEPFSGEGLEAEASDSDYYSIYDDITEVRVYDISDIDNISLSESFYQSGYCCSSRMISGTVYIVSTKHARNENDLPFVCERSTVDEATSEELPPEQIFSVENPAESNFLVVSSINVDNSNQKTVTKAILGSADEIYCNQEYLYVTAREYKRGFNLVNFSSSLISYIYSYSDSTDIIKVSLKDNLEFVASSQVQGTVTNQYSLDEYNGNLRVATTSLNENEKKINNLFVLDSNLNLIGSAAGFAENEDIKAVRYINDTAYVITYEETDPLFVIDVADPTNPQIKGEVKISGFSTVLVPVDDNTLLGIGYHTEFDEGVNADMEIIDGLKLVTFDVSDKSNPRVLDAKIFENYSSEVQYNPKALLVNFERGDYTIPMNYFYWDDAKNDYESYNGEGHSGILNFRVDNGKINIIDEYTSKKLSSSGLKSGNVERCVYIGDYIYMIGYVYDYSRYNDEIQFDIDCVKYK